MKIGDKVWFLSVDYSPWDCDSFRFRDVVIRCEIVKKIYDQSLLTENSMLIRIDNAFLSKSDLISDVVKHLESEDKT